MGPGLQAGQGWPTRQEAGREHQHPPFVRVLVLYERREEVQVLYSYEYFIPASFTVLYAANLPTLHRIGARGMTRTHASLEQHSRLSRSSGPPPRAPTKRRRP